ncbi:hypothetical protein ID866_4879 [Astraeus odoratus]|nr:hypothetical protein ID866_4879 [Astraeus odoratus]
MSETHRLLEAAHALSQLLRSHSVPHAFHGSILTAIVSDSPRCDEIYCIVDGGSTHPFRRVRQAIAGSDHFTITHSPWSNRLHTTYRRLIPAIEASLARHTRGSERDAHDIIYTLCRYWNRLDINRVPEHDMNHFVTCHRTAALSWAALKRKYGM